MTTNIRRILAATGAATLLTALGAFATIAPASASPADPGSPGTLSGNVVYAATAISPADACAAVDGGSFNGDDSIWECDYSYNDDKYDEQVALQSACTDRGGHYDEQVFFSEGKIDTVDVVCIA